MKEKQPVRTGIRREIRNFVVHLRWHYQLFILSGGYLMGGFFCETIHWPVFIFQFFNVHLLLYGGATAYNSFWDKDQGPVGGLQNPPSMVDWMWGASLLVQLAGLLLALLAGAAFVLVYSISMLFFWLYSTPLARWKGKPVRSMIAIGISTGTNSFLMGYFAAGGNTIGVYELVMAIGVAAIILSLYPTSQIFQMEEDKLRGDRTFAVRFGRTGVFWFFIASFFSGVILISAILLQYYFWLAIIFGTTGMVVGGWIGVVINHLSLSVHDYKKVMRIKFVTSFSFVSFLLLALLLKQTQSGLLG